MWINLCAFVDHFACVASIDNWSWLNGYKNRYGFVQLDLATQTRTVKKSGEWFAATAEHNGFD